MQLRWLIHQQLGVGESLEDHAVLEHVAEQLEALTEPPAA
jgi:hypothetical protein